MRQAVVRLGSLRAGKGVNILNRMRRESNKLAGHVSGDLIETLHGSVAGGERAVLVLSDVTRQEECGIEDSIGEDVNLAVSNGLVGGEITLNQGDRINRPLGGQIKSTAGRDGAELADGWKAEVTQRIVVTSATTDPKDMQKDVLDGAEALFKELTGRFEGWNLIGAKYPERV